MPINQYDGVLRKPFLLEHWHKGFVAGMAIWLPVFLPMYSLLSEPISNKLPLAIGIASAVSVMFFLAVITHHEGFTLDIENKRYRPYTWILGLHFGKWQHLPPIAHIIIRPYQKKHYLPMAASGDPVNVGFVSTETSWQVLLSVTNSSIGIIAAYAAQKNASQIATIIAKLLGVEVLNM